MTDARSPGTPRSVLMIAYHFPPFAGSSGVQRALRFVQHLPALGWQPLVLSAVPMAYERTSADLLADIPAQAVVRRAFALDSARHLAWRGRYVGAWARPDRWTTWRFDGIRQALDLVRRHRPSAIWSTYPIPTAHIIAAAVQRRTGLPWVADFRDPMAQPNYPRDPLTWQAFSRIEREAVQRSAASTFTTPGAAAEYRRRYPDAASRVHVLENGYDEGSFADLDPQALARRGPLNAGAVTLLHSGVVYESERDPRALMAALRRLHEAGTIAPGRFKVRFRASSADELLRSLSAQQGVGEYLEICPPVPYREALEEMQRADGLLVMQARNCNAQIPAKVYEYLRSRRPIVGLADPEGDTGRLLAAAGIGHLAALESDVEVAGALGRFLDDARRGALAPAREDAVRGASREARSAEFARLLDAVSSHNAARAA